MMKRITPWIVVPVIAFLVYISFRHIGGIYLFNDEWGQLGSTYVYGVSASLQEHLFFLLLGKNRVVGTFINNLLFVRFSDNVLPFVLIGLVVHVINSVLLYVIAQKITKSEFVGFIASVFFATASVSHQVFTWSAATIQTTGSMLFWLLSLLSGVSYARSRHLRWLFAALVSSYIAFLFKDNTIVLLPLLFILPFFIESDKKIPYRLSILSSISMIVGVIGVAIYKIVGYYALTQESIKDPAQIYAFIRFIINCFIYPLVTIPHIFVPFQFMLRAAHALGTYYSFLDKPPFAGVVTEILSEKIFADFLSVLLAAGMVFIALWLYRKESSFRKLTPFLIWMYLLNFIPIALFLNERNTSYIESRYLYFCIPPVAIFTGILLHKARRMLSKYLKIGMWVGTFVVLILFSFYTYKHISVIQREVAKVVGQSEDERNALDQFLTLRPTLPPNPVILLEGDSYFYVGIPVPFQLGPGYILMVKYFPIDVIPKELLVGTKEMYYPFFYNYFDEGYRVIDGKGFGFFLDRTKLRDFMKSHPEISYEQIVGFKYFGNEKKLRDITPEIVEYLSFPIQY